MAVQAYWISRRHRFHRDLAGLPAGVEVVLLPTGSRPDVSFNDFSRTAELIAGAYQATAAHLASLEESTASGDGSLTARLWRRTKIGAS